MIKPEIRKIIEIRALEFEIDPDLIEAFCLVESSGNPRATRYEANFYKTYIQPMVARKEIDQFEANGRATSWGLMQLMGQVAREKGFTGKFEDLFDPGTGLYWSLKHLKHFINRWQEDMDGLNLVIASYNAGSPRYTREGKFVNQVYVDKIHKYLKQIKEVV